MGYYLKIKNKLKVQRSLIYYISTSMLSIPVSLITSFISLKNIDVVLMGTWSAVTIFQGYAVFFSLGIVNGMNRELPLALGKNDKQKANEYASGVIFYSIILVLIYVLLGVSYIIFFSGSYFVTISVIAMVTKLSIMTFTQYLDGTFRSNSEFDKLSKASWIGSISRLILAPLILFGFEGFLLYMVFFDLIKAALLFYWRPIRVKPTYNKNVLFTLFKVGMPIFIATYLAGLIDTIPKLYILEGGGEKALGIFAPVLMLFGIFEQFSGALSTYIYPKLTYRFGQGEKIEVLFKDNLKITAGISGILIILVIPLYFALDYFVVLFPKYEDSLPYLRLGLFVAPFVTYNLSGVIFVIVKKFSPLYVIQTMKAVFYVAFIYIMSNLVGTDIIFSSITGIIVSYFLLGILGLLLAWYAIKSHYKKENISIV